MPPNEPNEKITRLVDMLVEEVSLVDRAANRRKFLVVKRSEPMPLGVEVVQRSDGTFTANAPAAASGTPESTPKANIALTKDAQAALQGLIDNALAMVEDAQAMVKKAKVVEDPVEQDIGALVELMSQVAEGFEDALDALGAQVVESPNETQEAPAAGQAQPTQASPMAMSLGKRLEVLRAERIVRKAQFEKAVGVVVQKHGKRMAKERLVRFKNALGILSSLLSELDLAQVVSEKAKPVAAPIVPVESKVAVQEDVAKLAKQVLDLQVQLKKFVEEAATLRNHRERSNALPVEKSVPRENENVSWPLDMNRPIRIDTIGKDSFFDVGER